MDGDPTPEEDGTGGIGPGSVPLRAPTERDAAEEREERLRLVTRRPGRGRTVATTILAVVVLAFVLAVGTDRAFGRGDGAPSRPRSTGAPSSSDVHPPLGPIPPEHGPR